MSEHDAHLSLTDTVRIIRESDLRLVHDPMEDTQRLAIWKRRQIAEEARRLHETYKASAALAVTESRLENTQPIDPSAQALARLEGAAMGTRTYTGNPWPNGYPHDFRDCRPRGHLDEYQKRIQDLRSDDE